MNHWVAWVTEERNESLAFSDYFFIIPLMLWIPNPSLTYLHLRYTCSLLTSGGITISKSRSLLAGILSFVGESPVYLGVGM